MLSVLRGQPTPPPFDYLPIGKVHQGADGFLYQEHELDCSDWSWWEESNPFKRPPLKVWKKVLTEQGNNIYYDTSETRERIPCDLRGRNIDELHNKHLGPVALLGNGQTLANHNLFDIPCPTIGMNRTYKGWPTYNGPNPNYYCFIDHSWLGKPEVKDHPFVINCSSSNEDIGYRAIKCYRMKPFSFDLWRDGVCPVNTGAASLQVATYLGFTEIYLLGFDYGKVPDKFQGSDYKHFDNTSCGSGIQTQPDWFYQIAPLLRDKGIKVYFVGSPDNGSSAFPHISFEEFLRYVS